MAQTAQKLNNHDVAGIFASLGLKAENSGVYTTHWVKTPGGGKLASENPATGEALATIHCAGEAEYEQVISTAEAAFKRWRMVPAPRRGDIVRQIGDALRTHKQALGSLVSLEVGKILSEGLGEVQEAIDICDFAVGLSRQLYGLAMHSERPGHRMYEQWHPLGVVGIITAFNFPCAVWAWNAAVAAVCGDVMVWKPSEKAPLTAIAMQHLVSKVLEDNGFAGVMTLLVGKDKTLGEKMAADKRIPLVSATGSTAMGRAVAQVVGARLGRSLLELGGNNAIIVSDDADLDLAVRAIAFGAVGTAGQRCTTTRRVFVHEAVESQLVERLKRAYASVNIGNPLNDGVLMGPLIDQTAVTAFEKAVEKALAQGGKLVCGGKKRTGAGHYVEPTIIVCPKPIAMMAEETFAPILYICPVQSTDQAIELQNNVSQGLSSAVFTTSLRTAEQFLGAAGSDCGIANVNIGTSGAEIGGAFGGEKDTGGGRESGSDAWKAYMRRQTCTINYSAELPLAQGVQFL